MVRCEYLPYHSYNNQSFISLQFITQKWGTTHIKYEYIYILIYQSLTSLDKAKRTALWPIANPAWYPYPLAP